MTPDPITHTVRWWLTINARTNASKAEVDAKELVEAMRMARLTHNYERAEALMEQAYAIAIRVQVAATAASVAAQQDRWFHDAWRWLRSWFKG